MEITNNLLKNKMSFSSLRPQSKVYILHKGTNPSVETGSVESVSQPQPKYNPMGQPFQLSNDMVVDLSVRIDGQIQNFQKLPANSEIADFGGFNDIVISTTKEATNSEILSYRQRSVDIIASMDTHKAIIEGCDNAYKKLNPEIAEKQRQEDEINTLKRKVLDMSSSIEELTKLNKTLLERIDGENGTKNKKENGKLEDTRN